MERMREYYAAKGDENLQRFETLKPMIIGEAGTDYAELSEALGASADSLRVQVHRMRQKYRETLRAEIAGTVSGDEEVDDEIHRLFQLMG